MFLRIIYSNGREILRECEEVTTVHAGDTEGGDYLQLSIDDGFPGAPSMTYIVPKKGARVYFMNNSGRTIDSFIYEESDDYGCFAAEEKQS